MFVGFPNEICTNHVATLNGRCLMKEFFILQRIRHGNSQMTHEILKFDSFVARKGEIASIKTKINKQKKKHNHFGF